MNAFGSPTRMLVHHLHHTGEQRQVNDLQQPARKIEPFGVHRITEFFGVDTIVLKRIHARWWMSQTSPNDAVYHMYTHHKGAQAQ